MVIVALFAAATWSGAEAATRIVDRTLVCPMVGIGYPDSVRFLRVSAHPNRLQYDPPSAEVRNGGGGGPLVSVGVRTRPGGGVSYTTGAVWQSRPECSRTRLRVALSGRGLQTGPPEGVNHRCDVPARVLIRIRAIFERPIAFSRDPRFPSAYSVTKGQVSTAYLAVTTLRGRKPLFFAALDHASGNVRAFVAPSHCRPER